MKVLLFQSIVFILLTISKGYADTNNPDNATLNGRVTDKISGEGLPGVSIYFPELKTGTLTDTSGNYSIENLPHTTVLVNVSLIGFKQVAQRINLALSNQMNFSLEESIAELNEVV